MVSNHVVGVCGGMVSVREDIVDSCAESDNVKNPLWELGKTINYVSSVVSQTILFIDKFAISRIGDSNYISKKKFNLISDWIKFSVTFVVRYYIGNIYIASIINAFINLFKIGKTKHIPTLKREYVFTTIFGFFEQYA